uniref:Uncharacterized protein n=1 Tax=Physcomitrium patens TaxID=3218 RepID=A0A2K1IVF8_PHYPA|nr:hypothetical protein PHYPA_025191 [Physcomitrium patens]
MLRRLEQRLLTSAAGLDHFKTSYTLEMVQSSCNFSSWIQLQSLVKLVCIQLEMVQSSCNFSSWIQTRVLVLWQKSLLCICGFFPQVFLFLFFCMDILSSPCIVSRWLSALVFH